MAKAALNEEYSDAVASATLLQQTSHQKMKLRAFFSAARTLQCSLRCFRARRAIRLRTAVKDAEILNRERLDAVDTIKCSWRSGRSRRVVAVLERKRVGDKANRSAGRIQ
jgi:hypothetical protein